MLARGRLGAMAVDGRPPAGPRRADGTRVHLLGVADHGRHLLDHLKVGAKHDETSHLTELLGPLDPAGVAVTFDAAHIPEGRGDHTTPAEALRLHGLD